MTEPKPNPSGSNEPGMSLADQELTPHQAAPHSSFEPASINSQASKTSPGGVLRRAALAIRARNLWGVARWGIWFGFSSWLIDGLWFIFERAQSGALSLPNSTSQLAGWPRGLFVALFNSWVPASAIGLLLGLVWALSIGEHSSRTARASVLGAIKRFLLRGTRAEHQRRISWLLASLSSLALFSILFISVAGGLLNRIVRPTNQAFALLGCCIGLALLCLLLLPICYRAASLWLRLCQIIPGLRRLIATTAHFSLSLAAALSLATILAVIIWWEILFYLPWASMFSVGLAALLALLFNWLHARLTERRPRLKYIYSGIFIASFLSSSLTGLGMDQASPLTLDAMGNRLNLARLGQRWVSGALDFDRDGFAYGFGGGDCAPFDAQINPGAIDIPNNQVDENCDGEDLDLTQIIGFSGRYDHPIPKGFGERPHVVFVTVDALAPNHLKAFGGYSRSGIPDIAPNISRLAAESVTFRACFAQGPSTRLSFPALFTSRYDSEIERRVVGKFPYEIKQQNELLAELFKRKGYHTAAVLPEAYFTPKQWRGITQGFNQLEASPTKVLAQGEDHNAREVAEAAIAIFSPKPRSVEPNPENKPLGNMAQQGSPKAFPSSQGVEASWDGAQPLFLWVHFYDAHWPQDQPKEIPVYGRTSQHRYEAEVTLVDKYLGQLVSSIREKLGENTLIVLSADHGVGFDKLRHEKAGYGHDLSSVVLHVPMLFSHPSLKPRTVESLCSTMDILPTLSNLVGLKPKGQPRGTSLVPELSGGFPKERTLFHQFYLPEQIPREKDPLRHVSIRSDRYNLILNRTNGTVSSWNWREDPNEAVDLGLGAPGTPEQRELKKLRQILDLYVYELHRWPSTP